MIPIVIILAVMLLFTGLSRGISSASYSSGSSAGGVQREKLENVASYDEDCVIDQLGWIDSESDVAQELRYFFGRPASSLM